MPRCEMCGTEEESLTTVKISQAELDVCSDCEEMGDAVREESSETTTTKYSTESTGSDETSTNSSSTTQSESSRPSFDVSELRPDYGEAVREVRSDRGMTVADLAQKVGEKESHIRKIEQGERRPTEELQHKLERVLDINLTAEGEVDAEEFESEGTGQTLGDVVDFQTE